jgi:hypothetical protein
MMATMRVRLRRPKILALALAASILAVAAAAYVVTASDDDSDAVGTQQPYEPWESAQLFTFPGDWDDVTPTTVHTTYPLQTSLQRMLRPAHQGSESVATGTSCAACHGNAIEEQSSVAGWAGPPTDHYQSGGCVACHGRLEQDVTALGQSLVSREFAAEFGPGYKPGHVDVTVQAAYDDEYFYIRMEWESERPGITHDLFRFDGEEWTRWSAPKPNADRVEDDEEQLASFEDRIAINIADGEIPAYDGATANFGSVGCYIGCHDSQVNMPGEVDSEDVDAHPYLGIDGIDAEEITKYLLGSRNVDESDEPGAWDAVKSEAELEALIDDGQFLDMWMWRGSRGGALGYADDVWVLEHRHGDDGTSAFYSQSPPFDYMFDPEVTGFYAIPEDEFEEHVGIFPLIPGQNAVPFDPDVEFQDGDIIPRRVLREPDGSRADILANSRWEDGRWIVEMRRRLDTGNPDDHALVPGRTYIVGVAVFDDHVGNRFHHVSFPVTIGLGVQADIIAVPLTGER